MTQDEVLEMARQTGVLAGYAGEPSLLVIFAKAMMDVEREQLIRVGLIGVLKHCEDLLREEGHEEAMNDVQEMIFKIRARGEA
jgi:hypothetical protein